LPHAFVIGEADAAIEADFSLGKLSESERIGSAFWEENAFLVAAGCRFDIGQAKMIGKPEYQEAIALSGVGLEPFSGVGGFSRPQPEVSQRDAVVAHGYFSLQVQAHMSPSADGSA
jgi:hypothetical protein